MEKKQLTWLLGAVFVVVVAAIAFSAILINTLIKGQVAGALSDRPVQPAVIYANPASASDGCVVPTGGFGGGEEAAASTSSASVLSALGGGAGADGHRHMKKMFGGRGAEQPPVHNVTNSSITNTKTVTVKNINSNNTIGSNNGSNNTTQNTNTTTISTTDSYNQGSYNTAGDDFKQVGFYESNSATVVSNNNETENKPLTITKIEDSFDDSGNKVTVTKTENKTIENHVDSHNNIEDNNVEIGGFPRAEL